MEHQQAWPGFSPGPESVSMSPGPGFELNNNRFGANEDEQPESPLVFMRTPVATVHDTTCPDSSKRFTNWMDSTSPYTARKTPPTASMKSMAAGDENTPPGHEMTRALSEKGSSFGSQQHFQAWLRATNSTSWTPRKSPAAGTTPPAPAPSPAATPMSIMRDLQHSAATPPTAGHMPGDAQRQRGPSAAAAVHDGFDTSDDGEDDAEEASTTIGAAQLAAAADRAAAANRMAGMLGHTSSSHGSTLQQARQLSTPPRVPAPSPALTSPAAPGLQQHQQAVFLQAAADRIVQDSLSTPMSQLSIGRRPGARGEVLAASGAVTPDMLVGRSLSKATASGLPASPAEKLIGLMLSPQAEGRTRHHHHQQQQQPQQQQLLTPSRLSAAVGGVALNTEPPLSPNLQVIDLMMHTDSVSDGATQLQQRHAAVEYRPEAAARAGQDAASDASNRGSDSSSEYGSACESDDEMDLSELQALCGEGVGPDTPLSVILGMLTGTPQVAGLTPRMGGPEQQQGALKDDIGPRVLFQDD